MTLRLILIRHAKSNWDNPFADDHARILNGRGQDSARAIGAWLAERRYLPDLVLCSDAVRARQTAALILPLLHPTPPLRLSPRLYHAAPDTMLDRIKRETVPVIAVIGHNPGIGILAGELVRAAPDHRRFSDYPTCATTVIDFDAAEWGAVRRHEGNCVDFVVPRDLIGMTGHAE
ncbi:histidine phosphatase family protein [Yoonia sp.]|uniref:SixA phosphatase family protein n=1 Tax=Yoonia sp. TaxID=2212373 RepID=UPI001A01806E|nr:histidine phosphatase family protein [Yoonia sp.]MBE0414277.1 histidine phosphatase family protein [Yoonia sp.]